MTKTTIARFVAAGAALTMTVGLALPAGAQTIAELQAQINALMAQLATLQGGSTTVSVTFTQDLTVGSTGSQVVALQQMLVAQGHLVMPAGVAFGYFGPLTKAAVVKWQLANGVSPALGYFGPISRAKVAATGGVTTGGTVTGGTTTGGGITTPGVEGTLTASLAPVPGSGQTVREGDNRKAVLGVELEAKLSDIRIERIKVKLDGVQNPDRDFYRDVADMLYVMHGSTVLGSVALNSSTVVEETTGNFYVTVTGLNFVISKDSEKTLTIAIDAQSSFDTAINGDDWTVTIEADGVRGVDGAGINQFAPSSGSLARTFETQQSAAEDASLQISTNTSSPDAAEVVASEGTDEDELDNLELLRFNARAEDDAVTITDLVVNITRGGVTSTATATTAYLFDGSTQVGSATVVGTSLTAMTATFDNIEVTVNDGSTKTLSVRIDVTDAGSGATTFSASITGSTDVTAENSDGDDITPSGSATGNTMTVRNIGLEITLVSKSIAKSATASQNNTSTSTAEGTFVLRLKAVGGDILLGTNASTSPLVTNAGTDAATAAGDAPSFIVYRGGTAVATAGASTTSFTIPTSGTVSGGTETRTIQENNTIELPVSFLIEGRTTAGALLATGSYAIGLEKLNWVSSAGLQHSTFMSGDLDWRTSTVSLP